MILGGQISAPNNTASSRGRARRREFAGDPVARSCRVRPMEGGLQLPTVEPVPEREGLSPGSETRTLRVSGSGSGGRIRCAHFGRGSSQVPDDAAQHSTAVNTSHRRRPHLPHPSTFIRRASSRLAPTSSNASPKRRRRGRQRPSDARRASASTPAGTPDVSTSCAGCCV